MSGRTCGEIESSMVETQEAETMSNTLDGQAPATPFLTHYFGGGLIDKGECYVVERTRRAHRLQATQVRRAQVDADLRIVPAACIRAADTGLSHADIDAPDGKDARAFPRIPIP